MSEHLEATLNFELAWRRVKLDIQNGREFVRHPYEVRLIEADLNGWIDYIRNQIRDGFNPSATTIADIPKGAGAVRPGALLCLEDRVVYAASVGAAVPAIYSALEWSQGNVDFSYQMTRDHTVPEWLKGAFVSWGTFRERSLQRIRDGASYVVVTDITGFYENIDIGTLISDLRQLGVDPEVVNLLSSCLNRWSSGNGRGIPQAISASDILAKLYLNSIDLLLREFGFNHLRYVDDVRIFCQSEVEAKKALLKLTQLLRKRGLNLQSAKTEILPAVDATKKLEAIIPIVRGVKDQFIRKVVEQAGFEGAYLTIAEADRLAAENPEDAPTDVLREVFDLYFVGEDKKFNGTLFRFIINRLRNQKDAYCHDYCLSLLYEHPEETKYVLSYLGAIGDVEKTMAGLQEFLVSEHAIYDYQLYQIFEWLDSIDDRPTDNLRAIARDLTFDNSKPAFLRAVCRRLLRRDASIADLERIESSYAATIEPLERAQILCDLSELEPGRRNSFLNRARRDHLLCSRAVQLVRENQI